jgi:hypothetical protein
MRLYEPDGSVGTVLPGADFGHRRCFAVAVGVPAARDLPDDMVKDRIRIPILALAMLIAGLTLMPADAAASGQTATAAVASGQTAIAAGASDQSAIAARARQTAKAAAGPPGGPLSRTNVTPLPASTLITGASWITGRYDPPSNQWGDILPTVWSDNGSTYVLMDDGGVNVPLAGGLWRQSLARVSGSPSELHFTRVGAALPPPRTWDQIGDDPDNDTGPLGPYYSIGFAEADGIFYATRQQNWDWNADAPFTGLVGIAYSKDRGKTWSFGGKAFPAPLGNLTFVDGGGPGGAYPDGYMYAIGTEREFNASRLLLGRVRPGIANVTDPAHWQWYAGSLDEAPGRTVPVWSSSLTDATPILDWNSHITYPEMTYDRPLHRYLLTFTYSYSSQPPAVWTGGAELVIAASPNPWGSFSFVAGSRDFGPSNGYDAGFPSQWISSDGRRLWLKWAANFEGCAKGLGCSGVYGFNTAEVQLTVAPAHRHEATTKPEASAKPKATPTLSPNGKARLHVLYVVSGVSLPLLLLYAFDLRRNDALRDRRRRR